MRVSAGLWEDFASSLGLLSAGKARIVISATPCAQPKTQGHYLGTSRQPREPALLLKPPSQNAEAGPDRRGLVHTAASVLSSSTALGAAGLGQLSSKEIL